MAEVGNQEFWLDYLPMWNQADGMIYFWRVVPQGNGVFTTGLYRIDPAGGEAEEVSDLTAALNNQVPFFDYQAIFLDSMSTIAPDGSKAAVVLASYGDAGYVELSVWTLDLAAADSAPTQILTQTDLGAAVPEWGLSFPATPNGLAWTADSNGLVVLALANTSSPQTPFQVFYYVDAASGTSTPVVDFSQLADYDAYFEMAPGTQVPWRFYSPWTASMAPDGSQLLMVNDLGGVVALLVAPLPPTGDLPSINASADESPMSGSTVSSRAADGKVIMYDLLLNLIQ